VTEAGRSAWPCSIRSPSNPFGTSALAWISSREVPRWLLWGRWRLLPPKPASTFRPTSPKPLGALCERERYDLVLIDSGPGDAPLLDALLGTAKYLLVPTRDDDASLSGVELLAARYLRARESGSTIQLLGVVLFDANPRATARNAEVLSQVDQLLVGSGAETFSSLIRSDRAAAVDLRSRHLTPAELVIAAEEHQKHRIQRLRQKVGGGERLWSRDPSGLAGDYQALTREILNRLTAAEQWNLTTGGVS